MTILAHIKAAVRLRDGMRCVRCGMTELTHRAKYLGRTLQVHRKVPSGQYTIEGCETLCCACHGLERKGKPQAESYSRPSRGVQELEILVVEVPFGDGFKERLASLAAANGRTVSEEVVAALSSVLPPGKTNGRKV